MWIGIPKPTTIHKHCIQASSLRSQIIWIILLQVCNTQQSKSGSEEISQRKLFLVCVCELCIYYIVPTMGDPGYEHKTQFYKNVRLPKKKKRVKKPKVLYLVRLLMVKVEVVKGSRSSYD